jgi:hypothetical protein
MIIDIESLTELESLGLLAERPAAAALLAELQSAATDRAALLAKQQAERETTKRLSTPIDIILPTVPAGPDDIAIIQYGSRPSFHRVTVDGQAYAPRLPRSPVSFLPKPLAAALDRSRSPLGWIWTSPAKIPALDELIGEQAFRNVVGDATPATIPVLIAVFRRLASRSGAQAKSLASLVDNKLSELSHPTSGMVLPSQRAEHDSEERQADAIGTMARQAGPMAVPPGDADRDAEQRRAANQGLIATFDELARKASAREAAT